MQQPPAHPALRLKAARPKLEHASVTGGAAAREVQAQPLRRAVPIAAQTADATARMLPGRHKAVAAAAAAVSTAAAAERGSPTRRRPRRPTRRRCRGEEGPRRGWRGWASSGRA